MAWVYDAPAGVYKNHALSSNIRRQAVAETTFMRFLKQEPGFGKGKGESLTITRYDALPLATRISETDPLPAGRPPASTKTVTVSQWGYRIPVTEFEKDLTFYDIMNPLQSALKDQIKLTMDKMAADAFKLTPIKYVPMIAGANIDTDGSATGVSDKNFDVDDLRAIHDYLHGDLKCPPFANGKYVGILTTKAARGIMSDPEYKDWLAPTTSEPLLSGRLKDIEGFSLFTTNNFDSLDNTAGTSVVTGEAIFFGSDSVGILEIRSPELRMGLKTRLGTEQDVGWVGTIESFLVWEKAAQARVVHGTSL